jgi:hypothetical protein
LTALARNGVKKVEEMLQSTGFQEEKRDSVSEVSGGIVFISGLVNSNSSAATLLKEINLPKVPYYPCFLILKSLPMLCRFFKQNAGVTLFDYLNRIKVVFACKLLMDK